MDGKRGMTLAVVGAGFGRTGTNSLKLALEQLGFGPCHHMFEVMEHASQVHTSAKRLAVPTNYEYTQRGFRFESVERFVKRLDQFRRERIAFLRPIQF